MGGGRSESSVMTLTWRIKSFDVTRAMEGARDLSQGSAMLKAGDLFSPLDRQICPKILY
jgi:hypothetical protein